MNIYCDLIEATVALRRPRLYQAVGIARPALTAAEPASGIALSDYMSGEEFAGLPLSLTVDDDSGTAALAAAD